MGSWAPEAFGNDAALDMVASGTLTASENHTIDHLDNFLNTEAHNGDPIAYGEIEPAYAACEIIAAARSGSFYWQSEGTTLGGSRDVPFFPKEVDDFLKTGPVFSDEDAARAVQVIDILIAKVEREQWRDVDSRLAALALTRERLLNPTKAWQPVVRERLSVLAERAA